MSRQLVLNAVPDDFSPETHAPLGPWCFFGREDVYPNWDLLPFVDPYEDPEVRAINAQNAIQTANALLDELWPVMNQKYGTDHDRAFWHTMLMNWLLHLVMHCWKLWDHVALFIETQGNEPLQVPLQGRTDVFQFSNTFDFIMACFNESPFRRWLVNEVVRRQRPPHWTLQPAGNIEALSPQKTDLSPAAWSPIGRTNGMGNLWIKFFDRYIRLLPRRSRKQRPSPPSQNLPETAPSGLLDLLRSLLIETMPLTLAQDFLVWQKQLEKLPYKKGRLHLSTPSYHSDQDNLQQALAAEMGERIAILQHGGTYGWARTVAVIGELEFCHDSFLTWGWTDYDDYKGHFVPMPPPLIGGNKGRHRPQDDRMILVGAAMYGFNPRIDNYPNPVPYRQRKLRFIEALPESLQGKLGYRPYHDPCCFADADYLRRVFPDLQIVEGDLMQAMLRAKLVVQDHHSTTLSITLGANIPTLGIWDERAWPLGRNGKLAFDKLRQAGIIFDDPAEAARHIERIWPDVQGWWQSQPVQDARKDWAAQFGWGSRWWWLHWLSRLPKL